MKKWVSALILFAAAATASEFPPAGKQRIPGFSSTTGAVAATDTIEQAISKLAGNEAAAFSATHTLYADAIFGSDATGNGSLNKPFQTIQAALNAIGSAGNSTVFNTDSAAYYVVNAAPGVYTENLTIPTRQYIQLNIPGVKIVGNVSWTVDGSNTGTVSKPKLIITGNDVRNMYTGANYPLTGITGNVTVNSTNTNQVVVDLSKVGIGGNILFGNTPGSFSALLFINEGIVVGDISAATGSQLTLYFVNTDTSSSKAIGSIGQNATGAVLLNVLRNVRFDGPVTVASGSISGARWGNVEFTSNALNNLTGHTLTVRADANSIKSFYDNFTSAHRGTTTIQYADDAQGVGFTPTTSANWSVVPATVQAALDALAAAGVTYTFNSPLVNTSGSVSCNAASGSQAGCLSSTDWTTFNNKEPALGNPSVNGYCLQSTTGGVRSWASCGGSGSPGGSNTQVQFNDSGAFAGADQMVWDKTNHRLTLGDGTTGTISSPAYLFSWASGNKYGIMKSGTVESIWGIEPGTPQVLFGTISANNYALRTANVTRETVYGDVNAGRKDLSYTDVRYTANGTMKLGLSSTIGFDSTNNYVSIGNSTLDRPLHIGGGSTSAISGEALLISYADTGQHAMVFKNNNVQGYHLIDSSNYIFGSLTSSPVTIRTANTNRMSWDGTNGNATLTTVAAASSPALKVASAPYTAGTATTNQPVVMLQDGGTSDATTWSTSGTEIGVNAPSGFAGNLADLKVNGTTKFSIDSTGKPTIAGGTNQQILASNSSGAMSFQDRDEARNWFSVVEEFVSSTIAGSMGWTCVASGTGASCTTGNFATIDAAHPGVAVLQTGTTTSGSAHIYTGTGSYLFSSVSGAKYYQEFVLQASALSTVTDTYTIRFGWGDATTATTPVDGIVWSYTNGTNSGNLVVTPYSNSVAGTALNTSTAFATGWHRYGQLVDAGAGTVQLFYDGASLGTLSSGLPTGSGRYTGLNAQIVKSAGTTNTTVSIDWVKVNANFSTARSN